MEVVEFWNSVVICLSYEVNPFFGTDKISLFGNMYTMVSKVLTVDIIKNLYYHFGDVISFNILCWCFVVNLLELCL